MKVIELHDLRFCWPNQASNTLSLDELIVMQGEHLFIRGASGSGKTTLLNLLAGILTPNRGQLQVLEQGLTQLSPAARDRFRADHLGIIFQQFNLLPYLSVLDNVTLPCEFSKRRREQVGDVSATAIRLLEHLGLSTPMNTRAVTALSVGQQQRVAVARALIGKPELIIADEPTSALDTDTRDHFLKLLFSEAEAQGSTIIFVSHDPQIAHYFPRSLDLQQVNSR
ncbi:ABC transporter ATP-binding protein [uncultured Thiothrix sp.]|uniref:ABC transporter ATP-binding protein n=1 Tax=uncultured Thiothrix sp. TaxID=223185 RepID=UPI0026337994|nr:ABC transporter ATP-binding protein [uncultured Thiothrix sp.]HMT92902.1 ABC transporter ATP-binding protein [Thiolinea sp.]